MRQVDEAWWDGKVGGAMTWVWSVQDGTRVPSRATKPNEQARTEQTRPQEATRALGSEGTGEGRAPAALRISHKVIMG